MNNLTKRLILGMLLGLIFGLLCFVWFSSNPNMPTEMVSMQVWAWNNPMMWTVIINRIVLGLVVAIAGFITVSPFCNFKIPVFLRWAKIGVLISLLMATWVFIWNTSEWAWATFWLIIWAGAVIGMIIDLIITKIAGEWNDLIIKK